jgi:SagB-type dehydrogenase family enzyme
MSVRAEDEASGRDDERRAAAGDDNADLVALANVVSFCNNLPISLYADTTVVKSPEVVYRGALFSRNRLVGEELLLNFRRSEADISASIGPTNFTHPMVVDALTKRGTAEREADLERLPRPKQPGAPIGSVIRSRRSRRTYSGRALSLVDLSTVLFAASGVSGAIHATESNGSAAPRSLQLRTVASGGGLYPIELHAIALNVNGLEPAAYKYWPGYHALGRVSTGLPATDAQWLAQFGEIEVAKSAVLLAYVYNVYENARKYGDASTGFAFMEVGGMSAHVALICNALGLGSCDVGGFHKRRFERLLDVDGLSRHMLHLTVIGG